MKTVRWGIIGCGDVTEVKSGPALQKTKNSSLTAVMRRDGERARDYAERHNVPRWYDNAEALINDPEVDAVYIATPPAAHQDYTLMSARAGKPVYVEKPMALNLEECQRMIQACRSAAIPLFVAYYRRALPRFLKIKELLDAQAIGEVRFVNVTLCQPAPTEELNPRSLPWRVIPAVAGGGYFVDLASHMLDFLDYVLGPIASAQGFAANQAHRYPAEDIVSSSFRFESGVPGTGTWCFSGYGKQDVTEIVGSEGKVTFATFNSSPVILTTYSDRFEFSFDDPPHIQQPLIQTVVNALTGSGVCPSTGDSAARTSNVMDQMLKN